ncbi:Asp-tRNA(Asn)/Glu-tRNA(Gln) amidotransferase subunit GatC [Clostridium sp. D2Q-14]|uniref:Asp-tRNA(Asn)/Glu-tRNA(Gln) amidotransferase subunit GatC n=1 Tax=Anaeromonas gelatinilytica TaxID=2683194 RepID=UPI00193B50AC|nr:Asp-tRNA(Asn)/Glu-tRNA(Gln) amidotransferase subunit GatC [Anaeromonas gelatinilytica]MBS4534714.1 Asp-tRNA(Asn)/Glu-tRNA(Gln) amidotransferase subunit GatC [Anaeromonas gelatinilytica]
MSVSKEQVKHVAKLSRLEFDEKSMEDFTKKFSSVINYVDKLKKVDTDGVKPTYHPHVSIKNVMREDEVKESLKRKEIMKNAPDSENGYIKIPKVLD